MPDARSINALPQVLRFFGYFLEAVTESNSENFRVRRVTVMHYLADDTLQITEPKQDNSGIAQVCACAQRIQPVAAGCS